MTILMRNMVIQTSRNAPFAVSKQNHARARFFLKLSKLFHYYYYYGRPLT